MVARSFVAHGAVYHDKIRRVAHRTDLSRGSYADQKLASGGEELFCDEDRVGGADGAGDNAVLMFVVTRCI